MRMLFVCLLVSVGLGACADRMWPPWLPAPISDDPEAQAIMGGHEPASPYLFRPYRPRPAWSWPTTSERTQTAGRVPHRAFDPERVSQKLAEGAARPAEKPETGPQPARP
jgi:hypothetical protein